MCVGWALRMASPAFLIRFCSLLAEQVGTGAVQRLCFLWELKLEDSDFPLISISLAWQ